MEYQLHPELRIAIETGNPSYRKYFENEYKRVSGYESSANPILVTAKIVSREPKVASADRIHRKLTFKKIFHYEYWIDGLETDNVTIYFKNIFWGSLYSKTVTLFLQAQILEPVLYYKLLSRNVLFMHAAGAEADGKGYLFPAYGGTGKTTLTLGLMGEGLGVLGDDLLLVEADNLKVYPYLRPLHIFTYNVRTLRGAAVPMEFSFKVKVKDILRIILETLTRQEFLISTRIHAEQLYPNFRKGNPAKVEKIVFLKKEGEHEKHAVSNENVRDLATIILNSEDLNDSLYDNILDASQKAAAVAKELAVIEKLLTNAGQLQLVNTRLFDFRDLSGFKHDILGA